MPEQSLDCRFRKQIRVVFRRALKAICFPSDTNNDRSNFEGAGLGGHLVQRQPGQADFHTRRVMQGEHHLETAANDLDFGPAPILRSSFSNGQLTDAH